MKKFLIYAIVGALLLALVSSLITGFVTRNNVQDSLQEECNDCVVTDPVVPPTDDKTCNALDSYANAHKAPEGFIWSAASASYQIEGDYEGILSGGLRQGRGWTNWDYITHNIGVADFHTGDDGSKFIEKLDEDIALLKSQGVTAYRFSLAWSRLIPSGYLDPSEDQLNVDKWFKTTYENGTEIKSYTDCKTRNDDADGTKYCKPWQLEKGGWNKAGEDMYRMVATKIRDAGMIPMVTLYHWDHPAEFSTWGGWRNRTMVDRFVEYGTAVMENLGDITDYWIIFNEPSMGPCLLEHEYIHGMNPNAVDDPNIATDGDFKPNDPKTFLALRHNLVRGTHKMFKIIKDMKAARKLPQTLKAGTTLAIGPAYAEEYTPDYIQAIELNQAILTEFDYHTAITGSYPKNQRPLWNMLLGDETSYDEIITQADKDEIALATSEFIGINFYSPVYVRKSTENWKLHETYQPDWVTPEDEFANGIIRPNALRDFLRKIKLEYGNIPTYITENGYGNKGESQQDVLLPDGSVDDNSRCVYVARHIKGVLEAAADGADVRSYTLWSSHDNLEWIFGYNTRFGSIYVDFADQYKRYPKKSFYGYKEIIKNNGTMTHDLCSTVDFKGQGANAD